MTLTKINLKNIALEILVIFLLTLPLLGFTQPPPPPGVTGGVNTGGELLTLISRITVWFAAIFFLIAVIFIILAAFDYLTAGGDETKVKSARTKLVYAVVAIVVAALSFFVPRVILNILDVGVTNLPG